MFQIIRIIIAVAFLLFIPGYLSTLILFKKLDRLEKIALSIVFSICFAILIGLILGFSIKIGITSLNLWISYIIVCTTLSIIYYKKK